MLKERYNSMMSQVSASKDMLEDILNEEKELRQIGMVKPMRRIALAMAMCCLCLLIATPVLAATVDPVYRIVYSISPPVAQFFTPVCRSSDSEGIRMEVESVCVKGNTVKMYVTMQDMTGDRVDETLDLFDSYSINRPFDCSAGCEKVGFDRETGKVRFLITIDEWGDRDITGDKITFTANCLIGKKQEINPEVPIELSDVQPTARIQKVSISGISGAEADIGDDWFEREQRVLRADGSDVEVADDITVSAIGYVDGKLHVQTANTSVLMKDNHGSLYLADGEGGIIHSEIQLHFANTHKVTDDRVDYIEYIFDVPRSEISNYRLMGDYVVTGMRVDGSWKVTVPIEN